MDGRVVVAGGTGFIGQALVHELCQGGYDVVVLSRRSEKSNEVQWDGKTLGDWVKVVNGATAIINLSGKPIACKWTAENLKDIRDSRILSTRVIGEAIASCEAPPKVWINSSAIGFYGTDQKGDLDESSPKGSDFMAQLCEEWEHACFSSETPNTRKICLRTGVVLGRNGGAFTVLSKLSHWFLGGPVGSGEQMMSWIHIEDMVRLIVWLIDSNLDGAINATSPQPVSNRAFMKELGVQLKRPSWPPVPAFAVKLLGAMGGPPPQLALEGQSVMPWRAIEAGFPFMYGTIRLAIRDLLIKPSSSS